MEEAKADVEEPSIRLGCYSQKLADLVVGADANGEGKVDRAAIVVVGIVTTEVIVLIRKAEGAYKSFVNENNEILDECGYCAIPQCGTGWLRVLVSVTVRLARRSRGL